MLLRVALCVAGEGLTVLLALCVLLVLLSAEGLGDKLDELFVVLVWFAVAFDILKRSIREGGAFYTESL